MLKNNHIHQERTALHKVKRQWVILSAVTLLGTAGINSINVNAASTTASNTTSTSSLANTTAGYSNAAATLGEAASNAMNRLATNIAAVDSYASIRTTLNDTKYAQTSAAIVSLVSNAHSESLAAQSAYNQIKVANMIASAANMPGGTLDDAARAASQASAAFTSLMNNLASTDRAVGDMSNAVNQIQNPTSNSTTSTTSSSTSSTSQSTDANRSEATSSTDDSSTSGSGVSASKYTEASASNSAISAAKKSITNAKRQFKKAKTAKARAKANQLLVRAQKNLLIVQNNYNYKYYYYFDGPFDTITTTKDLYVYSSKHLIKKYRIKMVPKGTTISVLKVLTDDNSSVFQVTGGNYITGKKSYFTK